MDSPILLVQDTFRSAVPSHREEALKQLARIWLRIAIGQTCP